MKSERLLGYLLNDCTGRAWTAKAEWATEVPPTGLKTSPQLSTCIENVLTGLQGMLTDSGIKAVLKKRLWW